MRSAAWLGMLVVLVGCAAASITPSAPADMEWELVTVGEHQLDVICDGGAGPTVMLLSGLGGDHSLLAIGLQLTPDANACFYDRPGDGRAPPPDETRTAVSDAADLHDLIAVRQFAQPIVLVGHSYGGLIALVAAAAHPEEIAGVVLVDGSHPDYETPRRELLSDEQEAYVDSQFANFPYVDFFASLEEAGAVMDEFPEIPLTIITATRSFLSPCDPRLPCEEEQALWNEVHPTFTALTADARHVEADTGHYVHEDDPGLVVGEIRTMLDAL